MSKQTRKVLKTYFKAGARPTQGKYLNLIDSNLNLEDTGTQSIRGEIHITGALDVLSSATLRGDITSSGNISSSGEIKGSNLSGTNTGDQDLSHLAITGSNVNFINITSSNNISASGEIIGSNLSGTNTGDQSLSHLAVTGSSVNFINITSSGAISSSGNITAASFVGDGSGLTNITVTSRTESISLVTASIATGSLIISGSDTYTSGSTTMLIGLRSSGSLIPGNNRKFDLGEPNNEWQTAFIKDLQLDRITTAITSSDIIPFGDNVASLGRDIAQYKTIHVTTASLARIDSKYADNQILISGSIVPLTDDLYDLGGGFDQQWRNLWIDGEAHIDQLSNHAVNRIDVSASLTPLLGTNWSLGSATRQWDSIYLSAFAYVDTITGIPNATDSVNVSASLIPFPTGSARHGVNLGSTAKKWHKGYIQSASVDYLNSSTGVPSSGTNTGIGSFGGVATGAVYEQRVIVSASLVPHGHLMYDLGAPGTDSSGGDPHPTSGITGTARQWRNLYLEGTASLNNIAGDPSNNMYVNMSASLVPSINNTFILGNNLYQWSNLYTRTASIGFIDGDLLDLTNGFVNSTLNPVEDNKQDLGSRALQWKTGHISTHSVAWIRSKENFDSDANPPTSEGTPIYVQGSFQPSVDNLYNLGSQASQWRSIWIDTKAHIDTLANEFSIIDGENNVVQVSASLAPVDDNIYSLGTKNREWNAIYIDGYAHLDGISNYGLNEVGVSASLMCNGEDQFTLGDTNSSWKESHINTGSFGFLVPKLGDGYDTEVRVSASFIPYNNPNLSEFNDTELGSDRHALGGTGDNRWGDLYITPPYRSTKPNADLNVLMIETATGRTIRTSSAWFAENAVSPGGPDTAIQFNTDNNFDGDTEFTYNTTNKTMFIQGGITSSGNISASGLLFISASESDSNTHKVIVIDTSTGRLYHTSSYASGGGDGGGGASDNLGNHTATQDLNLNSNDIKNVTHITASGTVSASIISSSDVSIGGAIYQNSTSTNYFDGSIQLGNNQYINSTIGNGSIVNVIGLTSTDKVEIAPSNIESVKIPTALTSSTFKTVADGNNHLISTYLGYDGSEGLDAFVLGDGQRLIVSMSQLPYVESQASGDWSELPIGAIFVVGGSAGELSGVTGTGNKARFLAIRTSI